MIYVPRQPPECISKESLLASAKNGLAVKILSKGKKVPEEPVIDNNMNRQKGNSPPQFEQLFHVLEFGMILTIIMQCKSAQLEPF